MTLSVLFSIIAIDALHVAMFIPVLNPYIISLGGTQLYLGTLGSCSALVALIWNPVAGSLSDTNGRKTMLLYCLGICFFSYILLLSTSSLLIIFIARLLSGLGCNIVGLVKTLLADNIPADKQNATLDKMNVIASASFIFGSVFSGLLSKMDNGIISVFSIISLMFLVNMGLASTLPDEKRKPTKGNNTKTPILQIATSEISKALSNLKEVDWSLHREIFTVKLCLEMSYGIWQSNFFLILIENFGATALTLGYLMSFMGAVGIITNLVMIKLGKAYFKRDPTGYGRLLLGMTTLIITYLLLSVVSNFYVFISFMIPMVAARALQESTLNEVLLSKASAQSKGGIVGAYDSITSFAGLVTPLISAIIAHLLGQRAILISCALPVSVGVGMLYLNRLKHVE